MKRKVLFVALALGLVAAVSLGFVSAASMLDTKRVRQAGERIQNNTNDTVIVWVNGEPILESDFESSKTMRYAFQDAYLEGLEFTDRTPEDKAFMREANSRRLTECELLDGMIRRRVLRQEMDRLGIEVSDEDARAYMDRENALVEQCKDQSPDYEVLKATLDAYIQGLGMTQEEYEESVLQAYKEELRSFELADYVKNDKEFQRVNGVIDVATYKEQLIEQAEIVYAEGFVPEGDEAE